MKLIAVLVLYCTFYCKLTNQLFFVELQIAFLYNSTSHFMPDLTKHRLSGDEIPEVDQPHKKTKWVIDY